VEGLTIAELGGFIAHVNLVVRIVFLCFLSYVILILHMCLWRNGSAA
jgi:hypothetical protein